jgi:hypothetical protein
MDLMWMEGNTRIGTLRVRGGGQDTVALRLAMDSLLGNADLLPTGLSPSAILLVRTLADPLPGRFALARWGFRISSEWQRAVRNSLAEIYRRAARPVQGYIPGHAAAVLFANESEMLACLALELSKGETWRRWWSKLIKRTLPTHAMAGLRALLCAKGRELPAVFHCLSEWGHAFTVVNALSRDDARTVLLAVSMAYGITGVDSAIDPPKKPIGRSLSPSDDLTEFREGSARPETRAPGSAADQRFRIPQYSRVREPWEGWLSPEWVPSHLAKERACLLGVGLSLYYRPAAVRSRTFVRTLRQWWAHWQQEPSSVKGGFHANASHTGNREEMVAVVGEFSANSRTRRVASKQPLPRMPGEDSMPGTAREVPDSHYQPPLVWRQTAAGNYVRQAESPDEASIAADPEAGVQGRAKAVETVHGETVFHSEEGIGSQLGGILYLINLMRHLNLPDCFEEDWGLASQVGAWGVLELLGRALLTEKHEHLASDPIWHLLVELDGRNPGELPGVGFRGSESFRLPVQWLTQQARVKCYWAVHNQRLLLWWDQGYLLCDVPRSPAFPSVQAKEHFRHYVDQAAISTFSRRDHARAPVQKISGPFLRGVNQNLGRWLDMVLPYLRFRLCTALHTNINKEFDLAEILLLHPGRLYLTSTHVDLVMNLDTISLPIRLAGLDFNPGWLPDYGKVIQFHFE